MTPFSALGFLVITISVVFTEASIGGYFTPQDKKNFFEVLTNAFIIEGDDVATSYYGTRGFQLLEKQVVKVLQMDNCAHLQKKFKHDSSPDIVYNALYTFKGLQCNGKLHTDETIKNIKSFLENEKASVQDIRFAAEVLVFLGQQVPSPTKVAQSIQKKLKEDDSLVNLGHALHAAALLGSAGNFAKDRFEDILVQADEVDGKWLQWEGGLTTTSLLLTGLLRFPGNPLTAAQGESFGNYLLTRKTVQTPRGVCALLEAAKALSQSSVSPVSISLAGAAHVTVDKPELKIRVSDILGNPPKSPASPVVAQSATRISDDVVVLAKQPLSPSSEKTDFVLPLAVEPGHYRLILNAGSHTATLTARVMGPIKLDWLEIGLSDADGSSAPKLTKLKQPEKLTTSLQADASQHLMVKFALSRTVHQSFLRLYSGKKEIIFVAEPTNKIYKIDVNLANELSHSGDFNMELIIGDAVVTNPIRWVLGRIELKLAKPEPTPRIAQGPKPEIEHLFRPAEKRPHELISLWFTILTLVPLLILFVLWAKYVGISLGNVTSLSVLFHVGLGGILGLFTLFWLKLDMFVTCGWLIPIGAFTFFTGHKMLSQLASKRKGEKPEK